MMPVFPKLPLRLRRRRLRLRGGLRQLRGRLPGPHLRQRRVRGLGERDDLRRVEAHLMGIPFVSLKDQKIDFEVLSIIPEPVARTHNIIAYKQGEMGRAVDCLTPIRYELPAIGGSHAQRDLFAMMLLDAAIRDGREALARSLAAERLCRMPNNSWAHDAYDRAMAVG